ncbi:hypothetical protein D7I47_02235 [Protaetiibacter intestinalis]|uniref:Uncharacterized protein n=1 Tax=Protaetiibacter intestinalis TaxID=2419774 RepID=A0A387B866_9MICO|nr:hypothetical protein D7I47_02235 [Protaetiibacter intestinalis]
MHDHGDSSSGIFRGRRSAAALIGILERVGATAVQQSAVNGEPGIVLRDACGDVVGVLALDPGRRRFRSVWVCTAPQKLRGWRRSDPADGDVTSEDPPLSTL